MSVFFFFFYEKLMLCKLFGLQVWFGQTPFFNLFHIPYSFCIKQMPLFWIFEIFFSRKVLHIKHFLVLNLSRSFSLVCSLRCHIISIANDKNCHETVSLGRDCVEALGKSSLILNSTQIYFCKEKIVSLFLVIFSFDQQNVWSLILCHKLSCYDCFKVYKSFIYYE